MMTIAIQGELGSYSHEAAVAALGAGGTVFPCPTFPAVFDALEEGRADHAVLPVENTIIGPIAEVLDLLSTRGVRRTGGIGIPIRHCLVMTGECELTEVRRVASHPAALAQCGRFLRARPDWVRVATDDTAGGVRAVLEGRVEADAVIASRRAAMRYGCEVALENIQDEADNFTRFVILQRLPGNTRTRAGQLKARCSSDTASS